MNFGDKLLLRGEECKTLVNLNFLKNDKTVNYCNNTGYKPENFLDLG